MSFNATIFGASVSGSVPGKVTPASGGLSVQLNDGAAFELSYHGISVSTGGHQNGHVIFSGQYSGKQLTIYVQDLAIIKAFEMIGAPLSFLQQVRGAQVQRRSAKRKGLLIGLSVVGLVGALLIAGWLLLGVLADWVVGRIPASTETSLGRSAARSILEKQQLCSDGLLNRSVSELGQRLVAVSGKHPYKFRFRVVNTPQVNAFALPGGYVFVNLGLLQKAETPSEVAGVLAHEVQHALRRHGLRNVARQAGLAIIFSLVLGGDSGTAALVSGIAQLGTLSFNRSQESEADRLGLELMYKAHFDPRGLPHFFERLAQLQSSAGKVVPTLLSTHPNSTARAKTLYAEIARRKTPQVIPLSVDWRLVRKQACKPVSWTDPDKSPDK